MTTVRFETLLSLEHCLSAKYAVKLFSCCKHAAFHFQLQLKLLKQDLIRFVEIFKG